jgi:hypothetical protein
MFPLNFRLRNVPYQLKHISERKHPCRPNFFAASARLRAADRCKDGNADGRTESVPLAKDAAEVLYAGELEARNAASDHQDGLKLPKDALADPPHLGICVPGGPAPETP